VNTIAIVASQLVGTVSLQGVQQAQSQLTSMGASTKSAQADLAQLQSVANEVSNVVQNRFAVALRDSQSSLQALASKAADAGIDTTKLSDLQAKAAVAADNLAVAQDRAAAALQKAANITIDAASSEDQIIAAQNQASLAADKVAVAENAAASAMGKLGLEAKSMSTAVAASSEKSGFFGGMMGTVKEKVGGFFGGIQEAGAGLLEFGSKIGMTIMGVQMMATMFLGATEAAGKMIGDFQQQMTKLVTTAGESQNNIKGVGNGILAMAGPTGTAVKALGDAMYWVESGGAHGAAGLEDLKIAAMGAKAENADLTDVSKVLMFTLNNFGSTGLTAAAAMNTLIAGVGQGSMTLQGLSGAISNVMPTARTFGISLTDIVAGLDTMTKQGDDASQAATHLAMMIKTIEAPSKAGTSALQSIGLTTQQVTDEMRKSLPDAIDMIVKAMKAKFPEGSTAYNEALKAISGGSRSMAAIMETSGTQMDTFRQSVGAINDAVHKGGNSIAGWAEVQQNFNFRMDQAKAAVGALAVKMGTELAPIATQLIGWFTDKAMPALNRFSDWFSSTGLPALQQFGGSLQTAGKWLSDFTGHGQGAIPILMGIGAAIATFLVPAVWSLAAGVIAATWPFLAIGVAIGGLTAVFLHFYNTSAGFRDFLANTWTVMQQIGAFIVGTFTPVWQQLQDVWKGQLQPALQELYASFKQLQPELTFVGEIIGGALLTALGLLVGSLGGIIGSIAGMAHGIAEIFGGIVQIVSGYIQIFTGFVAFIVDLFTGHFDKLGGDLKVILGGIGEIFSGFGNVLKGIVDGIVGGLTGGFKGAATSVIGYLNDIVYGVNDKTKSAATAAQIHTAEMKDKSIENAQKMNEGVQTKLINMRNNVEGQLKQTTDATQRHTLEMKLAAINNSLEMTQQVGQKYVDMRYKSQEQLDLMKQGVDTSLMSAADKAKYHSLNMKRFYLDGVIQMDEETVKQLDKMRVDIADQLAHTTDTTKQEALKTKLTQLTNKEETVKEVHNKNVQMRTDTESEMDKLKASSKQKHGDIIQDIKNIWGGIGNWFHGIWVDVQNIWGGIGQWFHDRWSEAWGGVTRFFGGIGQWFGDRWHDTQAIFGSIGAWFHDRWQEAWNGVTAFFGGIGHWFSDRWTEVTNSTKPFRDYMGAVFHTIWDIMVALWGKAGAKFQEWWGDVERPTAAFVVMIGGKIHEAWGHVTGFFGFLGKWFGDRWEDTKKILGGVGNWFHDLFQGAWNKVVEVWTPIGKWFGDRWEDTKKILGGVGNWFHDIFQGAWNKVTDIWKPIGKWFSDTWDDVKKKTSDKWNEIKTDASNIFKGLINGIIDQLNNGMSAFVGFINFFATKLNDLHKSLVGTPGTIPILTAPKIPHYAQGTDSHPGGLMVTGEEGPELTWAPPGTKVVRHKETMQIIAAMIGGKIPGYAEGIGDLGSQVLSWIGGGAKSILDNLINMFHISSPSILGIPDLGSSIFNKVKDWALSFIDGILPKFNFGGQSVNIPGNVQSWIEAAMALTGVAGNWAGPLGTIAMKESGGRTDAINLTDSNALAGHPSQGIMQMIPSTFAAHALPGHTNILNPIDNIASSIGYIKGRYGDVFHVPGIEAVAAGKSYIGYANGGVIDEPIVGMGLRTGTRYGFGERGAELVTPYIPSGVNLAQQSYQHSAPAPAHAGQGQPIIFQVDGATFARIMLPYTVSHIRNHVGVWDM